ncbi:MAG TPA: hypothetical protein VGF75_03335 [Candidatus Saccharimonadales bacterium]|jgi:metal-responsive CopG/Arc/MetJ family transcriptional regulator
MKTAVSIPDNVYVSAEKLANRFGESRSQLYAKALTSYIKQHQNTNVTDKLNEVYDAVDSRVNPSLLTLQAQSLSRNSEW